MEANMRDIIKTERLTLRQLTLEDAPALSRLVSDYDISRMTGSFPYPLPLLSAEFRIMYLRARRRQRLAYPYAITRNGGELMGMADLFRDSPDAVLEIGYWTGKPFWGQGYVSEAARAIIDEARTQLGAKSIVAGAFSDNPASLRVLKKLGFVPTGETQMYFSMGRMEKAHSLSFHLNIDASKETPNKRQPLRSGSNIVMRA